MNDQITIDGYTIYIEGRKLVIYSDKLSQPVNMAVNPIQASKLSVLLSRLLPNDYSERSDFRIPVTPELGLETRLVLNDRSHEVATRNISGSGVYAESNGKIASVGDVCSISFVFDNLSAVLDAVVTRATNKGVGAAFTEKSSSDKMQQIVMAVQRKWISVKSV